MAPITSGLFMARSFPLSPCSIIAMVMCAVRRRLCVQSHLSRKRKSRAMLVCFQFFYCIFKSKFLFSCEIRGLARFHQDRKRCILPYQIASYRIVSYPILSTVYHTTPSHPVGLHAFIFIEPVDRSFQNISNTKINHCPVVSLLWSAMVLSPITFMFHKMPCL